MFTPRPGQIEHTRTSEQSELWTPVKIGAVIGLFLDGGILCVYLAIFVVWLWKSGVASFWDSFSESFWGWPWMLVLMILSWPAAFGFVTIYRLAPEIINKNWPPTTKAIDPLLGMVSAWTNMGKRESDLDRAYEKFRAWDEEGDDE
jgi:hypothetical protein